jgi:hypothetical protein
VVTAYSARAAGQSPQFAPLPVQYVDYALWQRDTVGDPDDPDSPAAAQLAYWRTALAGLPELIDLPTDRARPARPSLRGAAVEFALPAALHAELDRLARAHGATLFMVVHAALAVLLGRMSGSADVGIGAPVAGRGERALDELVGMFVNTLVLRARLDGKAGFADLLAQVRETDLAAFANADVPFERLVADLVPTRSPAYNPLYQVTLAFQNFEAAAVELPGLTVAGVPAESAAAKTDLQVTLQPSHRPDGQHGDIAGVIVYATDLFDEPTIALFARRLERVLAEVVADPRIPVADIEIAAAAPVAPTVCPPVEDEAEPALGVVEQFTAAVEEDPEAPALETDDDEVSYGELDQRSSRLARVLLARGGAAGAPVRVSAGRAVDFVVALWAVLKTGATAVLDQNAVLDQTTAATAELDATALLADPALRAELDAASPRPVTYRDRPRPIADGDVAVRSGDATLTYRRLAGLVERLRAESAMSYESRSHGLGDTGLGLALEAVLAGTTGATMVLTAARHEVSHLIVDTELDGFHPDTIGTLESLIVITGAARPTWEGITVVDAAV